MTEEDSLQIACVHWFKIQYPKLILFHIPNGGSRSVRINPKTGKKYSPEAQRFKRMGMLNGVPDLFLSEPFGGFHGLYIEMKSKTGKASNDQKEVQDRLRDRGYKVDQCHTFGDFQKTIRGYLEGSI